MTGNLRGFGTVYSTAYEGSTKIKGKTFFVFKLTALSRITVFYGVDLLITGETKSIYPSRFISPLHLIPYTSINLRIINYQTIAVLPERR